MKRRTACALFAAGLADRLWSQTNPWDEETRLGLDALEQGYRDQAEQHLQRAFNQAKAAKADDLLIAACLDNLALPYERRGSEKLYREALAIREKRLKPGDPAIARSLAQLGSALLTTGDSKDARPLLDRALKIAEGDPMNLASADVFLLVGLFRSANRNADDVALTLSENFQKNVSPLYQRALEVREQQVGTTDLQLAEALELNGVATSQTDGAGAAQAFFTRAAEIRKRHIQKLSPITALPLNLPQPNLPAPPPSDGALRIGAAGGAPSLVNKVEPEYSELARRAKWQGEVGLSMIVTATGDAGTVRLVRSLGLGLDEQAYFAVRQWKFRPGMKEGQPVNVRANIAVTFRLL